MSRQCAICGKKPIMAWVLKKLRGKYNPTIKKRKLPNLQWMTLPARIGYPPTSAKLWRVAGGVSGKRVKACTKCIRTLAKKK